MCVTERAVRVFAKVVLVRRIGRHADMQIVPASGFNLAKL
jgi:hypothetical protein